MLTFLAALCTTLLAMPVGAAIAMRAKASLSYSLTLAALLLPFAVGEGVWAYLAVGVTKISGISQQLLLTEGSTLRAAAILALVLAKTVPLGAFFCAATLQRELVQQRDYFAVHRIVDGLSLASAVGRIPQMVALFVGLYGGAAMACESSLPLFLFRAGPGTGPETVNLVLLRIYKVTRGIDGPHDAIMHSAWAGFGVAAIMFACSLAGVWLGRFIANHLAQLVVARPTLTRAIGSRSIWTLWLIGVTPGVAGFLVVCGLAPKSGSEYFAMLLTYKDILLMGILVGSMLVFPGLCISLFLRYRSGGGGGYEPNLAIALLLPAYLPAVTIKAVIGVINSELPELFSPYLALVVAHVVLHFSVFLFLWLALVRQIPDGHVAWELSSRQSWWFILLNDGVLRHYPAIMSLWGISLLQVFSDGSVSSWFSQLVSAPSDALVSATFGKMASIQKANLLTSFAAISSVACCCFVAQVYSRELRS